MRRIITVLFTITLLTAKLTDAMCQSAGTGEAGRKIENSPVKEIIVICKTHFDIGYTHRVKDIVQYYRTTMIDNALTIMEASKDLPKEQQFAWTAPGWVMSKVMEDWPGQSKQRREKLDDAFRSGKFIVHAMPFTTETDGCEVEELARGLGFASQLCRRYNLSLPVSCKVTDVPSHAGALATVLANGGIKFIHIGCNWPSGYVKTPGLFWWEGPDGSRILTLYSPVYGTCYGLYPKDWTSPNDPMIGENLIPAKDWPYKVWPAIIVTPDNSGPPKAERVKAMFDEIALKMPGVKVHMGTMDDFVNAILKENPKLQVVKGEMPDTWIHGIMCDPGGIRLSREVHPLLASAEALNSQLQIWGIKVPPASESVALAYEKILLYGEHTWGGAMSVNSYGAAFKKLPSEKYSDLEASWEDKTDYIREASRLTHGISDSNMISLARSVKHDGRCIIVYNPLPWKRSGIIEIDGKHIFVKDVPPCGYLTYPLESATPADLPVSSESIENSFFRITFNPAKGSIISLIDKQSGREWADKSAEYGLGRYLNERFTYEQTLKYALDYQQGRAMNSFGTKGDWPHPGMHKPGMISEKIVPYRAAASSDGRLKISRGPESQTATLEMAGDTAKHMPASMLKVTLYKDQKYIDLEITIKDKAKDNWPEADWLCLPFRVVNPVFHVYRPLGVMNPATDIMPGANRHLYSVGSGVTITGSDGSGIAVCPVDHPLVSLDQPGCWKFSSDFVPAKPVIYLNLYNNQWNTNFRYWYPGTWSSRVRIWTINKSTAKDEVIAAPALEARNPLQAILTQGNGGSLPDKQAGLTVSRKGVIITAFGTDPDENKGTLLRVWEQAGISGKLIVTLPKGMKAVNALPVNLRGEKKGEPIKIVSGKLEFELGSYAPASFILQ
jgi:alpha-mannosidase